MNLKTLVKKPKYVRKYDFLRYFYRPKSHWFIPTTILQNLINQKIKEKLSFVELEEDDEDTEVDAYEYFKEAKDHIDMDLNDPKIIEGNIIDKKARNYISQHEYFKDCEAIDLDKQNLNLEQSFKETMRILKEKDNVIIFQSCFILNNKVINKPDAIIKKDGVITLIEVKGTTTSRRNHVYDLAFQYHVINPLLKEINLEVNQFYLCLIKIDLANVKETNLYLVNNVFLTKNGFSLGINKKEHLNLFARDLLKETEQLFIWKQLEPNGFDLNDLIFGLLEPENAIQKKFFDHFNEVFNDRFESIIDELKAHEIAEKINLEPSEKFKSFIKDNDYWLNLKEYYFFSMNYLPLCFSGNLIKFKDAIALNNQYKTDSLQQLINYYFDHFNIKNESRVGIYREYLFSNKETIKSKNNVFYKDQAIAYFKTIKNKKVYFDFESLNLALRVVNQYPPFMQTVNQVSVIIDHNQDNQELEVVPYIVIDPINGINKNDFKKIIDAIMPTKDLETCNEYSYIVYNKSFELTRLKEMSTYINEEEYFNKVEIIRKNIFDLADFFNISTNKERKNNLVCIKELYGYYSIKKVLHWIKQNNPEIFTKALCKDYKTELELVHNGVDAQRESTKRFFNLTSNEQWQIVQKRLGEYCDNDVRAMIAVYYFLKKSFEY